MNAAATDPGPGTIGVDYRLADGVELIGPYDGSGYRAAKYVVARADGQVVQLSELLFRIASALDGRTGCAEVARLAGTEAGRELSAADVDRLVRTRLSPAGLVHRDDAAEAEPEQRRRSDHLMMLRFRAAVVPPRAARALAGLFRGLHRPSAVVLLLGAAVVTDVVAWIVAGAGGLLAGGRALLDTPTLVLAVLGVILLSGIFHECGHVSACRYGGARPGAMGVGIYLVWPAFYSTVTDSYRLSRAGRLRTDLGGVYFNALFIGVLSVAYLVTGSAWLLVVTAALHVETMRQFLPTIRLDGYYILSDVIGVPDLFTFLGPVLRGMIPGRPSDPRVALLKPGVRRAIRVWVLLVVPFLAFFLISFLAVTPRLLPEIATSVWGRLMQAAAGVREGAPAAAVLGVVQAALLVLPVLGGALLLGTVVRRFIRPLRRRLTTARADRAGRGAGVLVVVTFAVAVFGWLGTVAARARPAGSAEPGLFGRGLGVVTDPALPDLPAQRQLAAAVALVTGSPAALTGAPGAPAAGGVAVTGVLLGVVAALLLWPLCRRLGLPAPVAGLAVSTAGIASALVASGSVAVGAGAIAALWLIVAALLAGRGRGTSRAAVLATVLAVVTAPVTAVAVPVFVAHAVLSRRLGTRLGPAGRWVVAGAAVLVADGAVAFVVSSAFRGSAPVPAPDGALVGGLGVGVAVVVLTWMHRRAFAPVASGVLAMLPLALLPAPRASVLAVAVPALCVLAAGLADRALPRARPALARTALATALVLGVVVTAPAAVRSSGTVAVPAGTGVQADTLGVVGHSGAPEGEPGRVSDPDTG